MAPILIIALGGILGLIGTGIAIYGTYKHNFKSSERNQKIDNNVTKNLGLTEVIDTTLNDTRVISLDTKSSVKELKTQNTELIKKINDQKETIDNLRRENTDLYTKLSNESLKIYNNINGGNSFCRASWDMRNYGEAVISILINGEDPLYDVHLTLTNCEAYKEGCKKYSVTSEFEKIRAESMREFNIGNLNPGMATQIAVLNVPMSKEINYVMQFSARNGIWSQCYKIIRLDKPDKYMRIINTATRVAKSSYKNNEWNEVLLFEDIGDEVKAKYGDKIDWNW
ncbi:hypothetical protein [Fibrella aquatilis]|uniref:Uncharacterized protein n=1 Tax=Fibrella aquatilis TaxID=2817059 RepID=A0A939JZ82_9BACT|nr:hypothetical protein [Fibrella aquatilis]MBO0934792.1 hypothetical protein [Fibrella aquatilis]